MVAIFEQTEQAEIDRDKVKSFVFFGENLGSKVLGIYFIRGLSFWLTHELKDYFVKRYK